MKWTASKIYKDETVFILAGGPSLRREVLGSIPKRYAGFDGNTLRKFGKIITINDSWKLAPIGSVNYFCDDTWWTTQVSKNPWAPDPKTGMGFRSFHDQIYKGFWVTSSQAFLDHPQIKVLKFTGERGLEKDPSGLRHGSNSGYQAINLAYHLGAKKIVLLGYDMKCQGNRTHWHNEERPLANAFSSVLEKSMLPHFASLVEPLKEAGIEVVNANPNSVLDCWPKASLEEILNPVTV